MVCYELDGGKLLVAPNGINGRALIVTDIDPKAQTAPSGSNIVVLRNKKVAVSLLSQKQNRIHTTGKEPVEFYTFLYGIVSNIENENILDGLGEVLNDGQKDWVKSKLKIELLGLIQRQIDMVL